MSEDRFTPGDIAAKTFDVFYMINWKPSVVQDNFRAMRDATADYVRTGSSKSQAHLRKLGELFYSFRSFSPYLFVHGNMSLIMPMVNAMRKLRGYAPVSHELLDDKNLNNIQNPNAQMPVPVKIRVQQKSGQRI